MTSDASTVHQNQSLNVKHGQKLVDGSDIIHSDSQQFISHQVKRQNDRLSHLTLLEKEYYRPKQRRTLKSTSHGHQSGSCSTRPQKKSKIRREVYNTDALIMTLTPNDRTLPEIAERVATLQKLEHMNQDLIFYIDRYKEFNTKIKKDMTKY